MKSKIKQFIVIFLSMCFTALAIFVLKIYLVNNEDTKNEVVKENNNYENSSTSERIDIDKIMSSLTLEEKVAQLFIIFPEQLTPEYNPVVAAGDATKAAVDKYPVGGVIYLEPNLESKDQTKTMLSNIQKFSNERIGLPMFLCVDEEGGQISRIANNKGFDVPVFENMCEIGKTNDASKARNVGETIGEYLSDMNFNLDFAPVADVLSNPENTVVKLRAFGDDPEKVSKMADDVGEGLASKGIIYSYKHFPGHGDTKADTHEGYAFSNKTKDELYKCELIPFIKGIENGVPMIMVGHISFPNIIGDNTPASLSDVIITDILKNELNYQGLIITDALNMGAISKEYSSKDAAVKAFNAGADIILMPENFVEAYAGMIAAVKDGTVSYERLDESVYKIIKTKMEMSN